MRLGLFWLGHVGWEIATALRLLPRTGDAGAFERLVFYTVVDHPDSTTFVRRHRQYPFDTVNDLCGVFSHALESDLDFAVISFGNGVPTSFSRLASLLASEAIQRTTWSFRVSPVSGTGMRHPSRIPLIDDHFIILNVRNARNGTFFDRPAIHASHFAHAGGRHAHLLSMIEYSVREGELNNHYEPESSRNHYGHQCRFNAMPFHLCETTGFMTCYVDFKRVLREVWTANLSPSRPAGSSLRSRVRLVRRGQFWYLRSLLNVDAVTAPLKRRLSVDKWDFKKRYDTEK